MVSAIVKQVFNAILTTKIYKVAKKTPLEYAPILSKLHNNQIFIKREDLQSVFSFKVRGAFNKIQSLTKDEKLAGIVVASAGNHAQGVALSAQNLNINAIIVMPETTPEIKIKAVKSYGATVILHGDTFDDANKLALQLSKDDGLNFIPPFDDPLVIAGQGTIAIELLEQHSDFIDAIFVPIGGGGLIAGIATYIKTKSPKTKIIGVEPEDASSMHDSLKKSKIITLKEVGIFADGVAVKQVGQYTFEIAKQLVDEIILVSIDETCAAIKDIFDDNRSVAEPAGAIATAGMKKYIQKYNIKNQVLITIESGANINFDRLRHVAERAAIGEKKEIVFAATIDEKPGSFKYFCQLLGKQKITEFNYRYSNDKKAHVFVGIETDASILEKLIKHNISVVDLSDNEMAKQHIRYMVGGRMPEIKNERVYRFEFPERPGALLDFLKKIGSQWNISLFHYRNHGAAFGRVLVGVQVPKNETIILEEFFSKLNFHYIKEESNPAYKLFL